MEAKKLCRNLGISLLVLTGAMSVTTSSYNIVQNVEAASVCLNTTTLTLKNVRSYTLKVKNTSKKATWSSSNKKVATVSSGGTVKAVKNGTCYVYAKVNGKTLKCKVTVKTPGKKTINPTSIKMNKTSVSINKGSSYSLSATISPSNATNKTVKWSSSNTSVATVSSSGKVTAKKAGTCYIYAKTTNNKKASCKVTVIDPYTSVTAVSKLKAAQKYNKIMIVSTTSMSSQKCYFQYFEKADGKWSEKLHITGLAGKSGYGKVKTGDHKTPIGIFTFTKLFGIKSNPGTILPYTKLTSSMYWCGEYRYNQFVDDTKDSTHKKKCSHKHDEHLANYSPVYNYVAAFSYNPTNTKGKGSALFLHCTRPSGKYTLGCVAVNENYMKYLMQKIDKNTCIIIDSYKNISKY